MHVLLGNAGYATSFRVMNYPDPSFAALLLHFTDLWLSSHPNDPEALLVRVHVKSAEKGDKYLIRQLLNLMPKLHEWYKPRVLATVADLQSEQGDHKGEPCLSEGTSS